MKPIVSFILTAFLVAGVSEFACFSLVDPHDLYFFGHPIEASRDAIYTVAFLCFWAMGAASAALSTWLLRGK